MKKKDVLAWGMKHIAANYGMSTNVDYEDESICIFGGCRVPMLNDVRMLCDDMGIPREAIESCDLGVDIYIEPEWLEEGGLLQQDYTPTGQEFWKRHNAVIGEEILTR